MTEAKTPGELAYIAYEQRFERDGDDWSTDHYTELRDGWHCAAEACRADLVAENERLRAENNKLKDDVNELTSTLDEARTSLINVDSENDHFRSAIEKLRTLDRYQYVSDGKRYSAVNRSHDGKYVEHMDIAAILKEVDGE